MINDLNWKTGRKLEASCQFIPAHKVRKKWFKWKKIT